jgi:hypothetical protein
MKTSKIKFLPAILAASVLSLTSCENNELENMQQEAETTQGLSEEVTPGSTGKNGNYIVVFKDGVADTESENTSFLKSRALEGMKSFKGGISGFATKLSASEVAELKNDNRVAFIEEDQEVNLYGSLEVSGTAAASSTQVASWGATTVGFGNGAVLNKTAWIIDSGIQLNHPDLNVDVARSRSFVSGTTSPTDQYGHGTMVAGIIGAKNNTIGSVGIAAGIKLVSLRVMNATGAGSVSSVISALNYVSANGKAGDVVNLSLGANPSLALDNAVKAVANKGIFVTIAAGNSTANSANYSPARVNHTNVFTISGMRPDKTFMGMSNWGTPIDYCAPGNSIRTTLKGSAYGNSSGTSMAAPHVAGILLMKGRRVLSQGLVANDPDGVADKISKL